MPDEVTLIEPYCTKAWAEKFFSEYVFDEYWNDASEEKKLSGLKAATNFFDIYVTFFDPDGEAFSYEPDGTDDFKDANIPRFLKQACAQEAAYLLSLDDNPAEPHPLTILGMLSADGRKFDKNMVPPIFPMHVVKMLEKLGAEGDAEATGSDRMQVAAMRTTC